MAVRSISVSDPANPKVTYKGPDATAEGIALLSEVYEKITDALEQEDIDASEGAEAAVDAIETAVDAVAAALGSGAAGLVVLSYDDTVVNTRSKMRALLLKLLAEVDTTSAFPVDTGV